jgi:hypothetical protein
MLTLLLQVQALLEKGLSQEQVAADLGVTPEWVGLVTGADGYQLIGKESEPG